MTENKAQKIHIIGAGISGLIAAQVLENDGFSPVVIESTSSVGGRVKTDVVEGYQLDHGFQVLLDAYPKAKKYLDYKGLKLQRFKSGSIIYAGRKKMSIGDPLRDLSFLIPTIFANVGSFKDKLLVLKLNRNLKKKSLDKIFEEKETTTMEYLEDFGFSHKMIGRFFQPFFGSIYLEMDLSTSSRMFEFVYKMFGTGYATLPKAGIGAIAHQLKSQLHKTEFLFDTKVTHVQNNKILTQDGTEMETDYTIIATDASTMVPNLRGQEVKWSGCDTLYFEVKDAPIKKPIINLIAQRKALVSTFFLHDTLAMEHKGPNSLLSATVIKQHRLTTDELVTKVKADLLNYCDIKEAKFLKHYHIPKGLPKLENLKYDIPAEATKLKDGIYLAGDHLLNGSLNAAMTSGERAAQAVIKQISGGILQ